jgi:hypothetical protein
MTLLISLAALRSAKFPKWLNILGMLVGGVGILSIVPALNSLVGLFGLSQIVWFIGLGVTLLRPQPEVTRQNWSLNSGTMLLNEDK